MRRGFCGAVAEALVMTLHPEHRDAARRLVSGELAAEEV